MKNKPRYLQMSIADVALRFAKEDYPEPKYKVTKVGNTIYVDRPFSDGTFASVVVLTINRS